MGDNYKSSSLHAHNGGDDDHFRPSLVACKNICQKWRILESDNSKSHQIIPNGQIFEEDEFFMEYEQKVEAVRELLSSEKLGNLVEGLLLIDAVQQLCIDYHFVEEINAILRRHYMAATTSVDGYSYYSTLHDCSLFFRLLRQHGFCVPAGDVLKLCTSRLINNDTDVSLHGILTLHMNMFNKFKGRNGTFEGKLNVDTRGVVELYEAAQLRLEGEDILDEAEKFSSQFVSTNKLKQPYHKSIARFTSKNYIRDFQGINGWEKSLKDLAKMDYSLAQKANQQELVQISTWWRDLGLVQEFKQARNQPLKWYTWSMASLSDPTMSQERLELTKSITFIYVIDDIFDLYGTPQELTLFTQAVNRWDYAEIEILPKPLKMCYKALLDTTNEMGSKIYKKYGYNPINSLKSMWGSLCNAFLVEAKWFASRLLPTSNEYLENAKVSTGASVVLVHLFFLLGINEKTVGAVRVDDISKLISSVATILRLWDDFGSAKDENQNGNDGSYIECYMKENEGSTIEIAREHVLAMISSEWKCLNKECFLLNQNSSTISFTQASLNLARMVPLMYNYNEKQRLPFLEEDVKSALFDDTFLSC